MTETNRHLINRHWWLSAPIVGALLMAAFYALPAGSIEQSAVYDALGLAMVGAGLLGIRRYRPAGWLPWVIPGPATAPHGVPERHARAPHPAPTT